jgi:hypothetical protein
VKARYAHYGVKSCPISIIPGSTERQKTTLQWLTVCGAEGRKWKHQVHRKWLKLEVKGVTATFLVRNRFVE